MRFAFDLSRLRCFPVLMHAPPPPRARSRQRRQRMAQSSAGGWRHAAAHAVHGRRRAARLERVGRVERAPGRRPLHSGTQFRLHPTLVPGTGRERARFPQIPKTAHVLVDAVENTQKKTGLDLVSTRKKGEYGWFSLVDSERAAWTPITTFRWARRATRPARSSSRCSRRRSRMPSPRWR
jgi:hypothetical protein